MTDSDQPKRPTKIDARAGPAVICCVSAFLVGLGLRGLCLAACPGKIGIKEPSHPPPARKGRHYKTDRILESV